MYNYNPYQYGTMVQPNMPQQNFTQQKPLSNTQPIQTIEKRQQEAACYFVKSIDEFKVDVLPGIYYLGINTENKEIYIKKINDDGNVGMETYKLVVEKKEKSELQHINERLSNIEKYLEMTKESDYATD